MYLYVCNFAFFDRAGGGGGSGFGEEFSFREIICQLIMEFSTMQIPLSVS